MAAVKWKIPFVSLNGTQYRIDIYDPDHTGDATTLTGARDVFVTDEDSNDDFYHPVRTQTGTLQVVDPDGSLFEQLIPENNTHRFVRLLKISVNMGIPKSAVVWQGFLSSEVYSQTYTACTQVLSLSVNSVLAAMESVQLEETVAPTYQGVSAAIASAMDVMEQKAGVTLFDYVYFPKDGVSFITKNFNMSTFFDRQEQCNEDSVKYVVNGVSIKEMLQRICQFMGWVLRECGRSLYFCCPDDRLGMLRTTKAALEDGDDPTTFQTVGYTSKTFQNITWTGDQHTKSIAQGAKSVEVIANLSDFTMDIEVPECPVGNLEEFQKNFLDGTFGALTNNSWYMLANTNATAYSNLTYHFQKANVGINAGTFDSYGTCTINEVLGHMGLSDNSPFPYKMSSSPVMIYSGAFLCKEEVTDSIYGPATAHDTADGLHCVFLPGLLGATGSDQFSPIASLNGVVSSFVNEGYIKVQANISSYFMILNGSLAIDSTLYKRMSATIGLVLKFGDKYWNSESNEWQTDFCYFNAEIDGSKLKSNWEKGMSITETDGYLIPISDAMFGVIELSIMPFLNYYGSNDNTLVPTPLEITFSSLTIDNVHNTNNRRIERAENHYFRVLGANFSEKKQIDFQLGSDLNNLPSPSTPMEDETTPITKIAFLNRSGEEEIKRPEIDLLDRACVYYGKPRRRIELQVEHPIGSDIALQRIAEAGRTYVPLSENRDWAGDSSTLTCFEIPNETEYEDE